MFYGAAVTYWLELLNLWISLSLKRQNARGGEIGKEAQRICELYNLRKSQFDRFCDPLHASLQRKDFLTHVFANGYFSRNWMVRPIFSLATNGWYGRYGFMGRVTNKEEAFQTIWPRRKKIGFSPISIFCPFPFHVFLSLPHLQIFSRFAYWQQLVKRFTTCMQARISMKHRRRVEKVNNTRPSDSWPKPPGKKCYTIYILPEWIFNQ